MKMAFSAACTAVSAHCVQTQQRRKKKRFRFYFKNFCDFGQKILPIFSHAQKVFFPRLLC